MLRAETLVEPTGHCGAFGSRQNVNMANFDGFPNHVPGSQVNLYHWRMSNQGAIQKGNFFAAGGHQVTWLYVYIYL